MDSFVPRHLQGRIQVCRQNTVALCIFSLKNTYKWLSPTATATYSWSPTLIDGFAPQLPGRVNVMFGAT
jgi:hypothetical protein